MPVSRIAGTPDIPALLDRLRGAPFNYDRQGDHGAEDGWYHDLGRQPLPREEVGDPVPGGTWEIARGVVRDYAFVDPSLVRSSFDHDEPLEHRTMVLQLRVWLLRLYVGVRVTEVHDLASELDGRPVRIWGWTYGTLAGHVEEGERTFEVRKWLDSGEVEFVTQSFSRPAARNPIVRLGYRIVGRPRQKRFVEGACTGAAALVEQKLRTARTT